MDPAWDQELIQNGTRNLPRMGPEMDPDWDQASLFRSCMADDRITMHMPAHVFVLKAFRTGHLGDPKCTQSRNHYDSRMEPRINKDWSVPASGSGKYSEHVGARIGPGVGSLSDGIEY